jgi:hypothetical protein
MYVTKLSHAFNLFLRTLFILTGICVCSTASAQIGLINTTIYGDDYLCVNQSATYTPGPALCPQVYWKITDQNNVVLLEADKYSCLNNLTGEKIEYVAYKTYVSNVIEITATSGPAGSCGGIFFGITNALPIKFKLPGRYKLETEPKIKKEGGPSACQNATKTINVGPQTVGSAISGATAVECSFGGTKIYSVPANPSATFTWSTDLALNASVFSKSGNTATIKFNATSNINASGYVRVTVTDCGATTTRTLLVTRTAPPSGMNGPSNICVGSYGAYQATDQTGVNYSWSVSPTSIFSIYPNGSTASVNAFGEGSGVVTLNYNRPCDNLYMTERKGIYASNCGYSMAADSTTTLMVSPNPATDEAEVSYSQTATDYPVKIRNAYNKVVAAGTLRNGKFRVNTRHLPAGIYVVTVEDKERGVISVRMVKN